MSSLAQHERPLFSPTENDASGWTLVDRYLHEQQRLTAVERFTEAHESCTVPAQAKYYSALLPTAPPTAGEQYAFEVDLDACSGCKACVTACNALNGLDEEETWRDVGLLHGGTDELPFLQHVTAACHHCLDPACLNVCPVRAYEKDDTTGIVRHLDDQCIGCQYCILACPYDVPRYSRARGIVRKCDMCSKRLAVGEAPACVQSCPNSAIRITTIRKQEAADNCETGGFLPGAPDPHHTQPTTHYKTRKVFPRNAVPADYYSVRPEHAHWPLIVMLVLTQLSVGAFLVQLWFDSQASQELLSDIRGTHAAGALAAGLLALAASTLHLGRPFYAFRAIIGFRTSWLSREIVAFGLFAVLATGHAATVAWGSHLGTSSSLLETILGTGVAIFGLSGVVCSIKIYQYTRRPLWNGTTTSLRFLLTTGVLGLVAALFTALVGAALSPSVTIEMVWRTSAFDLCRGLAVIMAVKLVCEASVLAHLGSKQHTLLKRSALLLTGELAAHTRWRFCLGVFGGIVVPGMLLAMYSPGEGIEGWFAPVAIVALTTATLAGEFLERYLFFTAVVAPRMPGGLVP